MKVQHIGHAGFIVDCGATRIVIDPWFNPAFLKSWFPWPDNRKFINQARQAGILYISHAHEDHFDREFLRTVPDKYDSTLMSLLEFGDRPVVTTKIDTRRRQEPEEWVTLGDCTFQRWCPHAGEDLSFASVDGGVVTCPRHKWTWNARTGESLNGQVPLKVREPDE